MNYMQNLNKPDYGAALEQLQRFNAQELENLTSDDDKIEDMVNNLQQVKQLASEKEMILASNKSLAEYNLSIEPVLVEKRQKLVEVHDTANQLITEVTEKKSRLDALKNQTSLDTILAILQTKAAQSEEESEELAEQFLDGSKDIDSFLEEFLEKKQEAHLRRVKCDKMQELISNRGSVPSQRQEPIIARHAPPPPMAAPYPPWGAPNSYNGPAYPPSGMPMPMPMNNYYR